jgi:hypothetical protein
MDSNQYTVPNLPTAQRMNLFRLQGQIIKMADPLADHKHGMDNLKSLLTENPRNWGALDLRH